MPDEDTQAPVAETTPPAPAAPVPQSNPVSDYYAELAALQSAQTPDGYVDPHFVDSGRDPDAEEFSSTPADELADGSDAATPDSVPEADLAREQEQAQPQGDEESVIEQDTPSDDPDAPPASEQLPPPTDGSKPPQFRLRPAEGDKVGTKALWLMKRNPDLSLEDAVAMARSDLGVKAADAPADATATQADTATATDQPETAPLNLEQLEAEKADLKARRKEARKNLDYDALSDIEDRLDELEETVIPQARVALARSAEQSVSEFQSSATRAAELYPDAHDHASEFFKRMEEIDASLEASGDPLFTDPNKPLRIAQMAAKELHVAPKRKAQAQPAAAPTPNAPAVQQPRPPARVSMTAPLAAPGARSSPPPMPAIEQEINNIASEEDYFAAKEKLFATRR